MFKPVKEKAPPPTRSTEKKPRISTKSELDEQNLLEVLMAFERGDFSVRMPTHWTGMAGKIGDTLNRILEHNQHIANELKRLQQMVGLEGKLSQRVSSSGSAGQWDSIITSINALLDDLVRPINETSRVIGAVARGNLSQQINLEVDGRPLQGEFRRTAKIVNTMVDQLGLFASEVTRVAREVGTEGKLGGQAQVKGVAGTWKDLTDSVNTMADNLTNQVRNIAAVTTAVQRGDLSKKITVDVKGEILELKNTINTMVDQLRAFASEVTRVARDVGIEGKLGGQAQVPDVSGTWKDLTDNVNQLAANLTGQVRNIAEVTKAVQRGDLSKKITVDVKGEILELKDTINTMVDQLSTFASEVTRVAREVGTEGKLGGQAKVPGVSGTWKDLTDNVNGLAANLTGQVRNIAEVTKAVQRGDLSKKITVDVKGEILELKDTINTMVDQLSTFASEVTRVAREVGTEGKLGGQAMVPGVSGTWKDLTDNVNGLAGNLTGQVRNIAEVTTAVANGDLSKKITVEVKGEILELKDTINTMVDQLRSFASEVTRVAREVGTEGKLGGQAFVSGVAGTWKDLTDNVNFMAVNLTNQVRGIARVVSAVANGDLKQKLELTARGEIAELSDTINSMIHTLATFADQVTSVAREVGVEGKLGGQALVPGAFGTWKDLTDNVNQLAANLTTQVRAIAEVATAVTKGDLTRSIRVVASGEVAALKDNINQMISNLKETTEKNAEQDWLKTNLAKFTRMLQGQKNLLTVARMILSELAPVVSAQHGVFYIMDTNDSDEGPSLRLLASYAYRQRKNLDQRFKLGEGLVGQCALEKQPILLHNVPANYIQISSGLGEAPPLNIIVMPIVFEGQVKAVIELASFEVFSPTHQVFLEQLADSIGVVLNTIEANMRTESLLEQSQSLAQELQHGQQELQKTNDELEEKARLLADQNMMVERKNHEVELAKEALEEKAEQLALTSKYKSEFLANMSHELRSPLNSLLILSRQLADNNDGNLSEKQTEFAENIYAAGNDLLTLINDILDLSKIESGIVSLDLEEVSFEDIIRFVERNFRHIGEMKGLNFTMDVAPELPHSIYTDGKRLLQILKNLFSNAFKFTEQGEVRLQISRAQSGWNPTQTDLDVNDEVIAFSVADTGIGIPRDKQRIIFESFQQAEGATNRKYGGTGLGLSISREVTHLLGGDLTVQSEKGRGSTFTLFLPRRFKEESAKVVGEPTNGQHGAAALESAGKSHDRDLSLHGDGRRAALRVETNIVDDRARIQPGDLTMLIIEDDRQFAHILIEVAREMGFKGLIATRGESVWSLISTYSPSAITLDIHLPDIDGWKILGRLKNDLATRHIPVTIISVDEDRARGLKRGAIEVLTKPVDHSSINRAVSRLKAVAKRSVKNLLLIDPDDANRTHLLELVGNGDVQTFSARSAEEALKLLDSEQFDCIAMNVSEDPAPGHELIDRLHEQEELHAVPVVAYTRNELSNDEERKLQRGSQRVFVKDSRSPERLADELSILLHRAYKSLPDSKRQLAAQLRRGETALQGKNILVVDDDVRNLFALTSLLERQGVTVIPAESGAEALRILNDRFDIDIVLMDIMMPEMDGYETIRTIRANPECASLPIIAVTAKVMKGDRERCIEAGASDYVPKPIDIDYLIMMMRELIYR